MANWISKILTSGLGKLGQDVANIVDQFKLTDDEKASLTLEMEKLQQKAASELEQSMRQELVTKERIMVAELTQGDTYTKRARPTVVTLACSLFSLIIPSCPWPLRWAAWTCLK